MSAAVAHGLRATPEAFFANALTRARSAELTVISVPAPVGSCEAFIDAMPDACAVVWNPPAGEAFAGVGAVASVTGRGRERIGMVAERAEELWSTLTHAAYPGMDCPSPRLFGGFSFAPRSADAPPWQAFGDARFVLPRWCYGRTAERAYLSLAVTGDEAANGQWLGELERLTSALARGRGVAREIPAEIVGVDELHVESWHDQIEAIRRAIRAKRCDKVVAARCSVVELSRALTPSAVLTELAGRYPDCYRFGFRFDDAAFVGATPERLITRRGSAVETEALAGSIAADDAASAQHLLESAKDRGEQQLVVDAIERVLRPLCVELSIPLEPEIRRLRHVLHLHTPITGTLRAPTHVLELVAALHPTPAVGGVPTSAAMSWIAENEAEPRGWYASPVGWFDARGEGDFAVAIRSGVLCNARAYLYAGGGIVRDSDPDAELAETRLKQRALLGALGVDR